MREAIYIIKGEPESYVIRVVGDCREWTPARAAHRMAILSLTAQHDERPRFSGPLEMNVRFFFKYPVREATRLARGPYHVTSPSLLLLYRFVEEVTSQVLFDRTNSVISLNLSKEYAHEPRTEIILRENDEWRASKKNPKNS